MDHEWTERPSDYELSVRADMEERVGRWLYDKLYPTPTLVHARSGRLVAKLTTEQLARAFELIDLGTLSQREIGEEIHASSSTVSVIAAIRHAMKGLDSYDDRRHSLQAVSANPRARAHGAPDRGEHRAGAERDRRGG